MKFFERDIKISIEDIDGVIIVNSYLNDNKHEMKMTLKADPETNNILDIKAEIIRAPYETCQDGLLHINSLIGLTVKSGINKKVYEIMGGTKGCIHINDLLRECFVGAIQGCFRFNLRYSEGEERESKFEERFKGTCIKYK